MRTPVIAGGVLLAGALVLTLAYFRYREPLPAPAPAPVNVTHSARNPPIWSIAVVGAGFPNQQEYDIVVDAFTAKVMNDPFFSQRAKQIHFKPVAWEHRLTTTVPKADYLCEYSLDASFGENVGKAIEQTGVPGLTSVLVVNNLPEGQDACAAGDVMVVDRGRPMAVTHEFGHSIGGLFDEKGGTYTRTPPPVNGPNCTSDTTTLPWNPKLFKDGPKEGCWHDAALWNPGGQCRMLSTTIPEFCPACRAHLTDVFDTPPTTTSTDETEHTQFLVQLWANKYSDVVSRNVLPGPVPLQVRRGSVVAGAIAESKVCLGSSFAEQLLVRTYSLTADIPAALKNTDGDSIFAFVNCPGVVEKTQLKTIELTSLPHAPPKWITPEAFAVDRMKGNPQMFNVR